MIRSIAKLAERTLGSFRAQGRPDAALPAVLLIRLSVGVIFISEGIQKFLFPDVLGAGRFAKIGIPAPDLMAPFVGVMEVACGILVIVGIATRLAAVPLLLNMVVAIASTKLPILMEHGFWRMAHEARTDFAMILGASFLVIVGAGPWSVDGWVDRREAGGERRSSIP